MNETLSQFSSVAQLCLTLCNPMNCSMPGLPVHHQLKEFTQTHVHWGGDAISMPSHPLSSPSPPAPIPSRMRVFSNESTLHMRWSKYWSFSFSISPSNEHPGLIVSQKSYLIVFCPQVVIYITEKLKNTCICNRKNSVQFSHSVMSDSLWLHGL